MVVRVEVVLFLLGGLDILRFGFDISDGSYGQERSRKVVIYY